MIKASSHGQVTELARVGKRFTWHGELLQGVSSGLAWGGSLEPWLLPWMPDGAVVTLEPSWNHVVGRTVRFLTC